MKFAELKKSLASGQYSPIYLLTGDDEFLKTRAVDMLCAGIPYPEFNVINVDCPSSGELADILCAFPVMSDRRAVKVNTLNEAKELSKYLEHPDPSCTLIVRSIANAGARSKKRDDGLNLLSEKAGAWTVRRWKNVIFFHGWRRKRGSTTYRSKKKPRVCCARIVGIICRLFPRSLLNLLRTGGAGE